MEVMLIFGETFFMDYQGFLKWPKTLVNYQFSLKICKTVSLSYQYENLMTFLTFFMPKDNKRR